jgi:RNA polymerase sigma factor (TIGR02999 family)
VISPRVVPRASHFRWPAGRPSIWVYDRWPGDRLTPDAEGNPAAWCDGHSLASTCAWRILGRPGVGPASYPAAAVKGMTEPRLKSTGLTTSRQHAVARLLQEVGVGDRRAFDALVPLVYDELRVLARRQRRRWRGDETLDTTALMHEAYLRLVDQSAPKWTSHPHFLAVASRAMRQVLLDYAKRRHTAKRGAGRRQVSLEEVEDAFLAGGELGEAHSEALLAVEEALCRLERHDPLHARVVECRFYGGLTIEDSAEALGISPATLKRRWALAQAWLYRDLSRSRADVV